MALKRITVSIPEDLLSEAKAVSDDLSTLVTEALRESLRLKRVEKALASFGSWEDREEDSLEIVNELRKPKA